VSDALTRIERLVGAGAVHLAADVTGEFVVDAVGPRHPPAAVVRPASAAEVREVVLLANELSTPLVPVSSGAPHKYGDTAPGAPGCVMLDLRRLDRILRIDRRNRVVVLEPGVTWPQAQAALADHGMRITPPLRPRRNKSVVASLLERQPTLIPRYNHSLPEPLRDCGVVWGSGETLFTGEAGSGPPSLEAQWQAGLVQTEPKGPAQTDFYRLLTGAQGTMGVAVWASVKCELLPEVHGLRFVTADRLEQLVPLARELCLQRLGDELMVFNAARLRSLLGPVTAPPWVLVLGLGGRRHLAAERVRVQEEDAQRLAAAHGLALQDEIAGVASARVGEVLWGYEDDPPGQGAAPRAEVFFLTTLPRIAGLLDVLRAAAEEAGLAGDDVEVYVQPQHQGVSQHVECCVPCGTGDGPEGAVRLVATAGERLIEAGAYFSRPYGSWAGPVYARDPASREALRKVKAVFDPAGIMNPGKLCFGLSEAPAPPDGGEPHQGTTPRDAQGAVPLPERGEA
jgi:FAD/FMN-containing dehydrogenase